ncbi:desmoplakin [Cryptophlebia leucotreta granulovirus]|uniref:Desmoplakin n=1 Tax=Cryptophlebia leucotreta granulosis virus TaxID=35254 RepID=Q7T5J1_GVCL|nr:desmoplakin [Cryptophlebia leucotreta granulovirus]AAQ21697.1 desmoplakin [Cryptophlebia leucotreta granulovirus]
MYSLGSSNFLLDNDMILTRYKGVDVTPHTFNNLIKTITNHRSISNTSYSKSNFEEKIRDIILAFNPSLKKNCSDMTTEHLLISSLKVNDKKEVTHTYNYNTWGDKKFINTQDNDSDNNDDDDDDFDENIASRMKDLSETEWDAEKLFELLKYFAGKKHKNNIKSIKKRYKKYIENLKKDLKEISDNEKDIIDINSFKTIFQLKRSSVKECVSLLKNIKKFVENNYGPCDDSVEKYLYAFRTIGLNILQLKQDSENPPQDQKLINENQKLVNENEDIQHKNQALQNRVDSLQIKCNDLETTINYNAIELAKLGAAIGDKDCSIENLYTINKSLQEENRTLSEKLNSIDENYQSLKGKFDQIDEENTELLKKVSRLESRIQELEEELNREQENNRKQQETCSSLLHKNDKDKDDRERDHKMLINKCADYEREIEKLKNDKHLLHNQLGESKISTEEIINCITVELEQNKQQCVLLENRLLQKSQEVELCEARVFDIHNKHKMDHSDLLRKIKDLELQNAKLKSDNEKNYEEAFSVIEEKSELQNTIRQLKTKLDNEIKTNIDQQEKFDIQLKQLKEDHELQINDVSNSLTQLVNNKNKEMFEKEKKEMVKKFNTEKNDLQNKIQKLESEINRKLSADEQNTIDKQNNLLEDKNVLINNTKKLLDNISSAESSKISKTTAIDDSRKRKITNASTSVNVNEKKHKIGSILPIKNISFVKPNVRK